MTTAQSGLVETIRARFGTRAATTERTVLEPLETDWRGVYHGRAAALLTPGSTAEASAMIEAARAAGVPLVPQGGNTSMVGGATPPADGRAMILSTRRLNRIRSIDAAAGLAVVEAGVILADLHAAAARENMRFPLTLGARGSATIGGLVSTNAGGTQVLRWGTMRGLVAGLEAVLPDGQVHDGLSALKKDNRGYDLDQLLIAAEGTLGLVTAATLRLVPVVAERAVAWIGVASPHAALALLRWMEPRAGAALEGFELVPRESLDAVIAHIPDSRAPLVEAHPWLVLAELVGAGAGETLAGLLGDAPGVADATIAASEAQAEAFWRLRDSISEAERKTGPAMQHDISVPVEAMPDFMIDAARALEAAFAGTRASGFGHLGDGNVHFHVRAPAGVEPDAWRRDVGGSASRMVHDLVVAAGGSISAEHGIGQMKLHELERLSSPARMAALRAIKRAFDPQALFNPGKLVALAPSEPNS